jgi:predicted phosphodiesterase
MTKRKTFFGLAFLTILISLCLQKINLEEHFAESSRVIPNFNFAAVGDWGCTMATKKNLNLILDKNPVLVLGLGDYSYNNTAECWLNLISPIKNKTAITIGNHDDMTFSKLNEYMNYFNLTEQFYAFNFQNVHFVMMSTEIPFEIGSEQYNFVKNDLASASANSTIDWIVVIPHDPLYTSPSIIAANVIFRDIYHPLFENYGVDIVLQGHIHNYQRSYPLKYNPLNSSNPIITNTDKYAYRDPIDPIFAIIGTGGESLYRIRCQSDFTVAQRITFGILDIQIKNNGLTMEGSFYDNNGFKEDQFTLDKSLSDIASDYHYEPDLTFLGPNNTDRITHDTNESIINQFTMNKTLSAETSGYRYEPYLTLSGSNYTDITNGTYLHVTDFTVAAWFRTGASYGTSDIHYIVNKGGIGSEANGTNMSYGIWMTKGGNVRAGFETSSGLDHFITTRSAYNDGTWHYALASYDNSRLRLYIDGNLVASKFILDSGVADSSGTLPLRIGANSFASNGFFVGNIDEIRIWNRSLTNAEIREAYYNGVFSDIGKLLHIPSISNTLNLCPIE